MQSINRQINSSKKTFPSFPDTDVPLACLFIHIAHGYTTAQFLQDFPEVSEDQVEETLGFTIEFFMSPDEKLLSKLDFTDHDREG